MQLLPHSQGMTAVEVASVRGEAKKNVQSTQDFFEEGVETGNKIGGVVPESQELVSHSAVVASVSQVDRASQLEEIEKQAHGSKSFLDFPIEVRTPLSHKWDSIHI